MNYEYFNPLTEGYKKINVSKSLHNSVFKYRKRTVWRSLWCKYDYFANDWNIRVEQTPTMALKVVVVVTFPILLILHGLTNFRELKDEVYRFCNPRKTGSFIVDDITDDRFKEVMKNI